MKNYIPAKLVKSDISDITYTHSIIDNLLEELFRKQDQIIDNQEYILNCLEKEKTERRQLEFEYIKIKNIFKRHKVFEKTIEKIMESNKKKVSYYNRIVKLEKQLKELETKKIEKAKFKWAIFKHNEK